MTSPNVRQFALKKKYDIEFLLKEIASEIRKKYCGRENSEIQIGTAVEISEYIETWKPTV